MKAKGFKSGCTDSGLASASFTVTAAAVTVATPTITPNGGSYFGPAKVCMACDTPGATIRYTIDGSDPTTSSTAYATAFTLNASATVKAKGFKSGCTSSVTATASFAVTSNPGNSRILIPGTGWTGASAEPGPVGYDTSLAESARPAGWDAKAIARWDVVPYQTFDGDFNVGVVAFHMNDIDRVEFSVNGGPWLAVSTMSLNTQVANHSGIGVQSDGVVEYWATLRASDFADGPIEVRAIAWPKLGVPRGLESLALFTNASSGLSSPEVFVSPSMGSDANDGSAGQPVATLMEAMRKVNAGGTITLTESGVYALNPSSAGPALNSQRWVLVRGAPSLDYRSIIIGLAERTTTNDGLSLPLRRIHWQHLSLDVANVVHLRNAGDMWFDGARWFDSNGWAARYSNFQFIIHYQTKYWVTDSEVEDTINGFMWAQIDRNCAMRRICGDAFTNCQMVVNCSVVDFNNIDGWAFHSDLFQYYQVWDNLIAYKVQATATNVQAFLVCQPKIDTEVPAMSNSAFVDIEFDIGLDGLDLAAQLQGRLDHLLFRRVSVRGQRWWLRTDITNRDQLSARNVVFSNCVVSPDTLTRYSTAPPRGVSFLDCISY